MIAYSVGDSITSRGQWQAQVTTRLAADFGSGTVNNNASVPGGTTADMLALFQSSVLDPGDADYVIILGGVNDRYHDWTSAATTANLQAMYSMAKAVLTRVVAVTILPFEGNESWPWTAERQAATDAVNLWIRTQAVDVDYVVDGYTALLDPNVAQTMWTPNYTLYSDGTYDHLHPNPAGMVALGNAIYERVTWTAAQWFPAQAPQQVVVGGTAVAFNIRGRSVDNAMCVNFSPNRAGERYGFVQVGPDGFRIGATRVGVPTSLYSNGAQLRNGYIVADANGVLSIRPF